MLSLVSRLVERHPILMAVGEAVTMGLQGIRAYKMRAFLTILGVVMGIMTVTGMSSIVAGLNANVAQSVAKIGSSTIFIRPFAPGEHVDDDEWRKRKAITLDEIEAVSKKPAVAAITPIQIVNAQTVKYGTERARDGSLFRGRADVYPRRFESRRTGKSGYAPACANECVRGICEKPRIKCADCPHRRFLPVTDTVIRWHLSGADDAGEPFVAGVYPLLLDESCTFVAADFDKTGWEQDALAFVHACRRLDLPVALERSRSGRGAHTWLFFGDSLPASLARRLASFLLTEAMEDRPDIGLESYDRLFPNQDTLPQGGWQLDRAAAPEACP